MIRSIFKRLVKRPANNFKSWRASLTNEAKPKNNEIVDYVEMPGNIDEIKNYSHGIHTEEQAEKIRKNL